jgi:Tfp pilus assembly protein PilX
MIKHNNEGYVLIGSLLLLAIISVIAVSLVGGLRSNEVLSRNESNNHKAFYASETALSSGEEWIQNQTAYSEGVDCDSSNVDADCDANDIWSSDSADLTFGNFMDHDWWLQNSKDSGFVHSGNGHYIVQEVVFVRDGLSFESTASRVGSNIYRVVSEGVAEDGVTRVVLESTYAKRY